MSRMGLLEIACRRPIQYRCWPCANREACTESQYHQTTGGDTLRLASFDISGKRRAGFERDSGYVELASLGLPESLREFLALGTEGLTQLKQAACRSGLKVHPAKSVKLRAPVPDPRKIICIGLNYK